MAMKNYIANAVVRLHGGSVKLNKDQHKRRAHLLGEFKKNGVYELVSTIELKSGEEFGYDGDIPKSMADDIEELNARTKSEKTAAQKEAAIKQAAADKEADENAKKQRQLLIIEAIKSLDNSDDSLWTEENLPRVDAIESVLGGNISEEERDQAYAAMEADAPGDGEA